jgi:hypothetical protein
MRKKTPMFDALPHKDTLTHACRIALRQAPSEAQWIDLFRQAIAHFQAQNPSCSTQDALNALMMTVYEDPALMAQRVCLDACESEQGEPANIPAPTQKQCLASITYLIGKAPKPAHHTLARFFNQQLSQLIKALYTVEAPPEDVHVYINAWMREHAQTNKPPVASAEDLKIALHHLPTVASSERAVLPPEDCTALRERLWGATLQHADAVNRVIHADDDEREALMDLAPPKIRALLVGTPEEVKARLRAKSTAHNARIALLVAAVGAEKHLPEEVDHIIAGFLPHGLCLPTLQQTLQDYAVQARAQKTGAQPAQCCVIM